VRRWDLSSSLLLDDPPCAGGAGVVAFGAIVFRRPVHLVADTAIHLVVVVRYVGAELDVLGSFDQFGVALVGVTAKAGIIRNPEPSQFVVPFEGCP
jgi:hypothetical protein